MLAILVAHYAADDGVRNGGDGDAAGVGDGGELRVGGGEEGVARG